MTPDAERPGLASQVAAPNQVPLPASAGDKEQHIASADSGAGRAQQFDPTLLSPPSRVALSAIVAVLAEHDGEWVPLNRIVERAAKASPTLTYRWIRRLAARAADAGVIEQARLDRDRHGSRLYLRGSAHAAAMWPELFAVAAHGPTEAVQINDEEGTP